MNALEQELALLEMIQATTLEKKDFFLMHYQNKIVKIISPKLRNLIKKFYPDLKWLKEDEISMADWKKIEDEITDLKPVKGQ